MFALINVPHDEKKHFHFKYMLDHLIEKKNCKYVVDFNDFVNNKKTLKKYFIDTYGSIPIYYITFCNIGSLQPLLPELSKILKIVIISDDIHHARRLAKPRVNIFNASYVNLNTYGYQLNRWTLPNVKNNYFFPHSARWMIDFNETPITKVLVSGEVCNVYADRQYVIALKNNNIDILARNNLAISGEDYYKYLNKYLCCFVDTARDYVLAKVFEICAAGSLLLCMNTSVIEIFEQLGFVDNINYISCTRENIIDKINFIVDPNNRALINDIRKKGHELIKEKHNCEYRLKCFLDILDDKFEAKKYINPKYDTTYMLGF